MVCHIEFVLIRKVHWRFLQNVKTIPGEFQYALVLADIDKKNVIIVTRKACIERRQVS